MLSRRKLVLYAQVGVLIGMFILLLLGLAGRYTDLRDEVPQCERDVRSFTVSGLFGCLFALSGVLHIASRGSVAAAVREQRDFASWGERFPPWLTPERFYLGLGIGFLCLGLLQVGFSLAVLLGW